VTAPHCALERVWPALWSRNPLIVRYTIRSASPSAAELLANKKRNAKGTLNTH
jgi:hypothetical protein